MLNRNVDYQTRTLSTTGEGMTWTTSLTALPVQVEATGGGERRQGIMIEAGIEYVVTMHHRSIDPKGRFVLDGRYLNIVRALDPDGHRARTVCLCKEAVR